MEFDLKLNGRKYVDLNEKKAECVNDEEDMQENASQTHLNIPNAKPVTASIKDVLESFVTGQVEMVSTVSDIPSVKEGITEFVYENSEVVTYKKQDFFGVQVRGALNIDKLLDKLPELKEPVTSETLAADGVTTTDDVDGVNGVDGDVDDGFAQGNTGDCWVLSGTLALASTEVGKQIIKNSITVNQDGSVTVTFKGVGVSYTISPEEISKFDTDDKSNDAYSNGDNDMLVIELAVQKLTQDIASGKVKLDLPEDSYEAYYNKDGSIEGGFAQSALYYFTGIQSETHIAKNLRQGLSGDEVIEILQKAYETGTTALTFGLYAGNHTATCTNGDNYSLRLNGGHALAITNLTQDTVTFVNPWDSTKEYTMTWEEFAKLKIGQLAVTDLTSLVDSNDMVIDDVDDPTDPIEPQVSMFTFEDLKLQGFNEAQIKQYFDFNEEKSLYVLKSDIKLAWFDGEITTVEQLANALALESRNTLKEKGLSDQFIDKYFNIQQSTEKNADGTPKFEFVLNKDYSNYTVEKNSDGTFVVKMTLASGEGVRVVQINADGSIIDKGIEKKEEVQPDNGPNKPDDPADIKQSYTMFKLFALGFSGTDIEKYFDKIENEDNSRKSIFTKIMGAYTLKDNIKVPHYDGEIKNVEDLARVLGLESKKTFIQQGLTEEVLNKYFTLTPVEGADSANEVPLYEYKINDEFVSYTISRQGEHTTLELKRKDDSILLVFIRPNGSYREVEFPSFDEIILKPRNRDFSRDENVNNPSMPSEINDDFYSNFDLKRFDNKY